MNLYQLMQKIYNEAPEPAPPATAVQDPVPQSIAPNQSNMDTNDTGDEPAIPNEKPSDDQPQPAAPEKISTVGDVWDILKKYSKVKKKK